MAREEKKMNLVETAESLNETLSEHPINAKLVYEKESSNSELYPERLVQIQEIYKTQSGNWVIVAYDFTKNAYRTFRINRIRSIDFIR